MAKIEIDQHDAIEYRNHKDENLGLIYRVINKETKEKGGYISLSVRLGGNSWVEEGAVVFHANETNPGTTFNLNDTRVKRGSVIESRRASVLIGCEVDGVLHMGVSEDFALNDPLIPIKLDNVRIRGGSSLKLFSGGLIDVIDLCLEKEAMVEITDFESIIINDVYLDNSDLGLTGHDEYVTGLMIDGFGLSSACLFQGLSLYRDVVISDVHFSGEVDIKLEERFRDHEMGNLLMTGIRYPESSKEINIILDEKNIIIDKIR